LHEKHSIHSVFAKRCGYFGYANGGAVAGTETPSAAARKLRVD